MLVQTISYIIEMDKEKYRVKFLMKIVLYSCNTNHLLSCQIDVNQLIIVSVSKILAVG